MNIRIPAVSNMRNPIAILGQFGSEFFVAAVYAMHWRIGFLDRYFVEHKENENTSSHKE
jgi:hypothetical protein